MALVALATPALADWTIEGRVVGVSDGDTITVLDSEKKQHKVRINGIDAPEKGQAFGERSQQNLARMAHGKDARLDCHKTDRFGREVCKVWVQPADCPSCAKTLDLGYAQISAGLAWWFRRYANEQSPEDRERYASRGAGNVAGARASAANDPRRPARRGSGDPAQAPAERVVNLNAGVGLQQPHRPHRLPPGTSAITAPSTISPSPTAMPGGNHELTLAATAIAPITTTVIWAS